MGSLSLEIFLIIALILANGLFSMSELAILSARKARLQKLADEGDENARIALDLAENPNRFLSTIQIGITIVGILAGAFGGATLAKTLAQALNAIPYLSPYSDGIAFAVIVILITYLTLVIGELVPKQIALRNADSIALRIAHPMAALSRMAGVIVHLLTLSSDWTLRLLNLKTTNEPLVTEEEVRQMLSQATEDGVFEPAEEKMVHQIFRLADRKINAYITPRTDIVWLDMEDEYAVNREKILSSGHDCFPVAEGTLDNVLGLVFAKDFLAQFLRDQTPDLRSIIQPALYIPENVPALEALERMKETHAHVALVFDEYGGLQGLATIYDILEGTIGNLPGSQQDTDAEITPRADGSYLVDGKILIDQFMEIMKIRNLPEDSAGDYQTLGGFVMTNLGHIPSTGERLTWDQYCFEVVDMDGRRVDKVLVTPLSTGCA